MKETRVEGSAIVISGPIASGKTTLARILSTRHHWSLISFGAYVRHIATIKSLSPSRAAYQGLGERLIDELGYAEFLNRVRAFASPTSTFHLYDGVRNVEMLDEVIRNYHDTLTIYLELPEELQYARWAGRHLLGDAVASIQAFHEMSEHTIERGVVELRQQADFIADASLPMDSIANRVESVIEIKFSQKGF